MRARGQTTSEYVIILVAVGVICVLIAVTFGGDIQRLFGMADEEVGTMGAAEGGGVDDGGANGGGTAGGGEGADGASDAAEGDEGEGSDDDAGDDDVGGPPGGGAGGGRGGPGGGAAPAASGGDGIVRAGPQRTGVSGLGGEGDDVKVIAPDGSRPKQGTAAYTRAKDQQKADAARQDQERRLEKKRRRIERAESAEAAGGSGDGVGGVDILRFVLLAALVGIVIFAVRTIGGARSGGGGDDAGGSE